MFVRNLIFLGLVLVFVSCVRDAAYFEKKGDETLKRLGPTKDAFKEANMYYTQAIEQNPKEAWLFIKRADNYIGLEDHDRALRDIEKAIKVNPLEAGYYYLAADETEALGDLKKTLIYRDKTIQLAPKNDSYYNIRGSLKLKLQDTTGALKDYDQAIKLAPTDGSNYYFRGFLKMKMRDKAGACADMQLASKLGDKAAKLYMESDCKITFINLNHEHLRLGRSCILTPDRKFGNFLLRLDIPLKSDHKLRINLTTHFASA